MFRRITPMQPRTFTCPFSPSSTTWATIEITSLINCCTVPTNDIDASSSLET